MLTPDRLHAFRQIIDSLRPSPLADELEGIYAEVAADVRQPFFIGDLAKRIDVSPGDVLEAVIKLDLWPLWFEGQQFRTLGVLKTFIRQDHPYDPTRELEVNLDAAGLARLAGELGVGVGELTSPITNGA